MPVSKYEELSWVEIEALDKAVSVVFLPVGPLEEHGPHLPVGTDVFGAADIAERAAEEMVRQHPDLNGVLMPALPLGSCGVTADFPGTVSLRGSTLLALMVDVLASMAKQGFQYLVVSNHHLDPVHMKALLEAIRQVESEHGMRIAETASRIVYAGVPTREAEMLVERGLDPSREIHADVKETSFIRYRYPHLVKGDAALLEPMIVNIEEQFMQGKPTFRAMGAEKGYLGSPGRFHETLGQVHLEEGARLTADLAGRLIRNEPLPEVEDRMRFFLENRIQLD